MKSVNKTKRKKRVVVVLKSKKKKSQNSSVSPSKTKSQELFEQYANGMRFHNNPRQVSSYLREWYERVFEEFPPWDKHPFAMVDLKIAYELLKRAHDESGKEMSDRVKQNYNASKKFDVEGLHPNMRSIVKVRIKYEPKGGDTTMGKVTKVKKAKTEKKTSTKKAKTVKSPAEKRETRAMAYVRMFAENAKKKLPDDKFAKELSALHPKLKAVTAEDVARHRTIYNKGKFPVQGGKAPAVKVEQYGVKVKVAKAKAKKKVAVKRK